MGHVSIDLSNGNVSGLIHSSEITIPQFGKDRLLLSVCAPRLLAVIVTKNANGDINTSLASSFTVGPDNSFVMIQSGINTWANIQATKAFTVNLFLESPENIAAMEVFANFRSTEALERSNFHLTSSSWIPAPFISEGAIVLECEFSGSFQQDNYTMVGGACPRHTYQPRPYHKGGPLQRGAETSF